MVHAWQSKPISPQEHAKKLSNLEWYEASLQAAEQKKSKRKQRTPGDRSLRPDESERCILIPRAAAILLRGRSHLEGA